MDETQPTLPCEEVQHAHPPSVVLGRYNLGNLLGRGAVGQVHRATDSLTGQSVAVKCVPMHSPFATSQARKERSVLRGLALPGIVRWLDDGIDQGQYLFVTQLVSGPTLGEWLKRQDHWRVVGPVFRSLLLTLARLHALGVVHRDIKPDNIRMDSAGHPVILDFGLARGERVAVEIAEITAGTRRYAPPEQWRGCDGDERTDRFALGVMLLDWLAGGAVGYPDHLPQLARQLTAADPDDRPSDAMAVLTRLGGEPLSYWGACPQALPCTPTGLRILFGPRRRSFLHVESALATSLAERARGRAPGLVLREWIQRGFVYWDGQYYRSTVPIHGTILETPQQNASLPAVLDRARALARGGRLGRAMHVLRSHATLFREHAGYPELLMLQARVALAEESSVSLAVVRQRVEQVLEVRPTLQPLHQVLVGAYDVLRGNRQRGEQVLDSIAFEQPELERLRVAYLVYAARLRPVGAHRALLEALEPWATGDAEREGALRGWWAQLAYREGRWVASARLHREAAECRTDPVHILAARVNAAQAWLDALALESAAAMAERAIRQARDIGHATFEARATWIGRTCLYRLGRLTEPDPEWVDAAREVSVGMAALMAMTEAAIAWRNGHGAARELAERARQGFATQNNGVAAMLAGALVLHLDGDAADQAPALADRAVGLPVPEVGLQILALLPLEDPSAWQRRARDLAKTRPRDEWSICLDVLSISECLARLEGRGT